MGSKKNVTFIGLGTMGYPMAGHLSNSGLFNVRVFNRSSEKAVKWGDCYQGSVATTIKEAVNDADVVITCSGRDEDMLEIVFSEEGLLPYLKEGSIFIDHTTTSCKLAKHLNETLKSKDVDFIDAPVSGGEAGAVNGVLSIMAGGNNNISVGHIDSKFGVSVHQIPHVLRIVKNTSMKINGVHMHTGSDILDIDVFIHAAEILFKTALKFKNLEFIDFGSGFKVPYKIGDIETNIEELGEKLSIRFNDFCKNYGKDIELAFEPGKFLVSSAGFFLTKVNAIKQTTSTVFAQIDSGFNHLIRPMFYGSHHEIINISNPKGKNRFYTVVGYICETDTFANNRRISEISEGDILAFKNAGAYCFTMSSNYNSRYKPAEILFYNNKDHLIRKKENMIDILNNQILIDIN